jgi:hypothetical protein
LQEVLGQECISLEFRHLASYLLWYCQSHNVTDLLHLTIVLVGYFAAKNTDNQVPVGSFFWGGEYVICGFADNFSAWNNPL